MPTTISSSTSANAPVPNRKERSLAPVRTRFIRRLLYFDLRDRGHFQFHDLLRQWCVAKITRELLAVGECPLQEVHHGLRLFLVFRVLIEEQPRERRDRIRVFAGRVRDRDAEIRRYFPRRRRSG